MPRREPDLFYLFSKITPKLVLDASGLEIKSKIEEESRIGDVNVRSFLKLFLFDEFSEERANIMTLVHNMDSKAFNKKGIFLFRAEVMAICKFIQRFMKSDEVYKLRFKSIIPSYEESVDVRVGDDTLWVVKKDRIWADVDLDVDINNLELVSTKELQELMMHVAKSLHKRLNSNKDLEDALEKEISSVGEEKTIIDDNILCDDKEEKIDSVDTTSGARIRFTYSSVTSPMDLTEPVRPLPTDVSISEVASEYDKWSGKMRKLIEKSGKVKKWL